jgi:proteasome lid subunit RPN8/RPN11
LEWARFASLRRDPTGLLLLDGDSAHVQPRWDEKFRRPFVAALKVVVSRAGRAEEVFEIPLAYFHSAARTASSGLVEQGKLKPGEPFRYIVCAYPCEGGTRNSSRAEESAFSVQPMPVVLSADEQSLERFLDEALACGPTDDQMPVFVRREVLVEAVRLVGQAGAVETGGVLIGQLHRDSARRELFLEATALIPAEHTRQDAARLTFTAETWAACDAAVTLRGRGEEYVGWFHSHPGHQWCSQCPDERRTQCKTAGKSAGDFFSIHDEALHRTVFPRAYSIALVLSTNCEAPAKPTCRLYGWRHGMVARRGFHILGARGSDLATIETARQNGKGNHAPTS